MGRPAPLITITDSDDGSDLFDVAFTRSLKNPHALLPLWMFPVPSGVGRGGGGFGGYSPPLEVSWDLFFGISHFCSFKTVDLTRVFKKFPAVQAYHLTTALTKATFH